MPAESTTYPESESVRRMPARHKAVRGHGQSQSLGIERERSLAQRIEFGDETARQAFIEAHLGLVTHLARQYLRYGVPLGDLVQEGCVGLIQAADRFDWRRGVPFGAYASLWIKQAISRAIPQLRYAVRIPAQCLREMVRVDYLIDELSQRLQRTPSSNEIRQTMGANTLSLDEMAQIPLDPVSLDGSLVDGEPGMAPTEILADPNAASPEEILVDMAAEEQMKELLATLSEREQCILVRRLGLFGEDEHSFAELAVLLGLSRQRVKQIEYRALEKLRDTISARLDLASSA